MHVFDHGMHSLVSTGEKKKKIDHESFVPLFIPRDSFLHFLEIFLAFVSSSSSEDAFPGHIIAPPFLFRPLLQYISSLRRGGRKKRKGHKKRRGGKKGPPDTPSHPLLRQSFSTWQYSAGEAGNGGKKKRD